MYSPSFRPFISFSCFIYSRHSIGVQSVHIIRSFVEFSTNKSVLNMSSPNGDQQNQKGSGSTTPKKSSTWSKLGRWNIPNVDFWTRDQHPHARNSSSEIDKASSATDTSEFLRQLPVSSADLQRFAAAYNIWDAVLSTKVGDPVYSEYFRIHYSSIRLSRKL